MSTKIILGDSYQRSVVFIKYFHAMQQYMACKTQFILEEIIKQVFVHF